MSVKSSRSIGFRPWRPASEQAAILFSMTLPTSGSESGGKMAAGGNTARREHRHIASKVDDLRHERKGPDLAGVGTGLGALGDDHFDSGGQGRTHMPR